MKEIPIAKVQPRDIIDDTLEADAKLPRYTGYFDRESGIKRQNNVNQKTNDLQDTETRNPTLAATLGEELHVHHEEDGIVPKGSMKRRKD